MLELILIIFIVVFAVWLYNYSLNSKILGYSISDNQLIIRRKKKPIAIDMQQIVEIKEIQKLEKFSFWLFNFVLYGILYGFTGLSFSFQYGILHLYMTRKSDPLILLLRDNRKIVITPNNEVKNYFVMNNLSFN